jgi:beta-lactam-binding protein with PASTA domain/predicted  nucleic acid-binding Zn-ribbon protein
MAGIGTANARRKGCVALGLLLLLAGAARAQESRTVRITVNVLDVNKQPVPGAVVTLTQDRWGPEMRPFDYRIETGGDGVATADVSLGELTWAEGRVYWPAFEIEATKGSNTARDRVKLTGTRLSSGVRYPAEVSRTVTIRGAEVHVAVQVMGDDSKPVPGADVLISDSGAGGMGGARYRGVTDSNGNVTIPVLFWEQRHTIRASREGYETGQVGIILNDKQVGRTVPQTVTLKKASATEATELAIKVTREGTELPAADVTITFTPTTGNTTGLYRTTTNSSGEATLRIPGYGKFDVTLTQDTFEPLRTQVQLGYGEGEKSLSFSMKEKPTGEEEVTVTVLAGDVKNGRGGFQPIKGATVQVGNVKAGTDAKGTVTVDVKSGILETTKGQGYAEAVEVTASAEGYKSQKRTVSISRRGGGQGTGAASFVLEPGEDPVSEKTPITLLVEVTDPSAQPIRSAEVEFVSLAGEVLYGGPTNAKGQREFSSYHAPLEDLATLRRGLKVRVKARGHRDHESTVTSDLLQPQKEARKYSVQLEKDWSDLAEALHALEGRVNALKTDASAAAGRLDAIRRLKAEMDAASGRVGALVTALKAHARDAKKPGAHDPCKEAEEFRRKIETQAKEVKQHERDLNRAIETATKLAETCTSSSDPDQIRTEYQKAIGLIGKLGGAARQAGEANDTLKRLAEGAKDSSSANKLEERFAEIDKEIEAAKTNGREAAAATSSATALSKALPGRRGGLINDLNKLRTDFNVAKHAATVPADLLKQIDRIEGVLGSFNNDASFGELPKYDAGEAGKQIAGLQSQRDEVRTLLKDELQSKCEIAALDSTIEELRSIVTNASFEIGLAADLPGKADACAAKIADAANMITVPDITGYSEPAKAMQAARDAGLSPSLAAASSGPGTEAGRIIARQHPPAHSTAKRGDPLVIFLNQKVAEKKASATPTPVVAVASPTPQAELATVPHIAAGITVAEAKAVLSGAGFTAAFNAKGGKAPNKDFEFKTTGVLTPVAGSKEKRGSTVTVSIYQKFEGEVAAASASPTASPVGPTGADTMPNLIGLTLDQAVTRLTSKMRIGSDEVGDKPPTAEQAMTIFSQTPAAGSKVDTSKQVVVSVKRYGSAKSSAEPVATPEPEPPSTATSSSGASGGGFEGKWGGNINADGKRQYVTFAVRRQGNGYVIVSDQDPGKPIVMDVRDGNLFYETKLDFSGVLGPNSKDPDPTTIRATVSMDGDDRLQATVQVVNRKQNKRITAGFNRLP